MMIIIGGYDALILNNIRVDPINKITKLFYRDKIPLFSTMQRTKLFYSNFYPIFLSKLECWR